jgi:Uma2 family endonuclease
MTILIGQPGQDTVIPGWVVDLESFRRWVYSGEFPESGQYSHLDGALWVDPSMERREHNRLKTAFTVSIGNLLQTQQIGEFYSDGMLLTNVSADISTEPDGMFVSYESLKAGKLTFAKGPDSLEAIGTPDMALEVVSPTSHHKDTVTLRELYHRANVPEYWLVEPLRRRQDEVTFDILHWMPTGYLAAEKQDGWVESKVFKRRFRLMLGVDPLGQPAYRVEQR